MNTFDPFTATMEEAQGQADPLAVARWGNAQRLTASRAHFEANPLEGVQVCAQHDLAMPDWLAEAFAFGYQRARQAGSWDEGFGPARPANGEHLTTMRLRAKYGLWLERLFAVKNPNRLPRTLVGRQEAARLLGITEKQVRTLLPKTRSNVRGHKPYTAATAPTFRANDPFSLAKTEAPQF